MISGGYDRHIMEADEVRTACELARAFAEHVKTHDIGRGVYGNVALLTDSEAWAILNRRANRTK